MKTKHRESLEKYLKILRESPRISYHELLDMGKFVKKLRHEIENDKERALVQRCNLYIKKRKEGWRPRKKRMTDALFLFKEMLTKDDEKFLRKLNIMPPSDEKKGQN